MLKFNNKNYVHKLLKLFNRWKHRLKICRKTKTVKLGVLGGET